MSYHAYGMEVPNEIIGAIRRYVDLGIPTDGFLEAVICNNLSLAVRLADENNRKFLPAIADYLYSECPAGCWGWPEAFDSWIVQKDYAKRAKHAERTAAQ